MKILHFKLQLFILHFALLTLALPFIAHAAFNPQINYQGKLTNSSDVTVTDGPYSFEFNLYSVGGGGTALWTESWASSTLFLETGTTTFTNDGCSAGVDKMAYTTDTNEGSLAAGQYLWNTTKKENAIIQSVDTSGSGGFVCVYDTPTTWANNDDITNQIYVTSGLFSVMLGTITSLSSLDFGQTLYLGVTVGSDSEMKPRKVLGAATAAFEADKLDGIDSSQFLRSDTSDIMSASSSATLLTVNQTGSGAVADFQSATSSVLYIAQNGNVGIGTMGPSRILHTVGNAVLFERAANDAGVLLKNTANGTIDAGFLLRNTESGAGVTIITDEKLVDVLHLKSNQVGINDATPDFKFEIAASSTGGFFALSSTEATNGDIFVVNGAGNVGIGTSAPSEKLTIEGSFALNELASAPSQSSGYGKIYVKSSDSGLYFKNASGTETNLLLGNQQNSFSVHKNGTNQTSVTNGTKITWSTEDFDTNNDFDITTNERFTPTIAGKYILQAAVRVTIAGTSPGQAAIYKNGSLLKTGTGGFESVEDIGVYNSLASVTVDANGTTDYFEVFLVANGHTQTVSGASTETYFSGSLIQATGAGSGAQDDLDSVYDNDTDQIMFVDNANGLEFRSSVTGDIVFDLQSTGDFSIKDNGNTAFFVRDDGNIGIGTTGPGGKIHVKDTVGGAYLETDFIRSGNGTRSLLQAYDQSGSAYRQQQFDALSYQFYTSGGTTKVAIDSSGNVGIGTTSPSALLHVTSSSTQTLLVNNTSGSGDLLNIQQNGTSKVFVSNAGNVGIGTASPSYKLQVAGGQSYFAQNIYINTSSSAYGYWLDNTGGAVRRFGIYESGDDLVFRANPSAESDRMVIDGATGNVGIGTDSPSSTLHIASGNILLTNNQNIQFGDSGGVARTLVSMNSSDMQTFGTTNNNATFQGFDVTFTAARSSGGVTDEAFLFNTSNSLDDTDEVFQISENGTNRLTILGNGNVGIGTASPGARLSLSYDSSSIDGLQFIDTNTGAGGKTWKVGSGTGKTGAFGFYDQSSTTVRMLIDSSGNVGIGTTAPGSKLHVIGAEIRLTDNSSFYSFFGADNSRNGYIQIVDASDMYITQEQNANIRFLTNSTEVVRIDNAGNVGIGTTGPTSTLHVVGSLRYVSQTATTNTTQCQNSSGQLAGCTSLLQYKTNIENIPLGLETVLRLRPVAFDWKSGGNRDIGFIAEETEAVSPLLTRYNNGKLEGVRYSQMTALLARAIQEQQEQIRQLTLQEKNNELRIKNYGTIIDKEGNELVLTQDGTAVIERLVVKNFELAKGGTITLPKGSDQIIGKAVMPQDTISYVVQNPQMHSFSEIFLTVNGTAPKSGYSITNKQEGEFTLLLYEASEYPIDFTYWIVNTYDIGQPKEELGIKNEELGEEDIKSQASSTEVVIEPAPVVKENLVFKPFPISEEVIVKHASSVPE